MDDSVHRRRALGTDLRECEMPSKMLILDHRNVDKKRSRHMSRTSNGGQHGQDAEKECRVPELSTLGEKRANHRFRCLGSQRSVRRCLVVQRCRGGRTVFEKRRLEPTVLPSVVLRSRINRPEPVPADAPPQDISPLWRYPR